MVVECVHINQLILLQRGFAKGLSVVVDFGILVHGYWNYADNSGDPSIHNFVFEDDVKILAFHPICQCTHNK